MKILKRDNITSLELVEQINIFRKQEGASELNHYDLLKIIRDEFKEEIGVQKILEISYKHKKSEVEHKGKISCLFYEAKIGNGAKRKQPMYVLTYNQARQLLARESKTVRKAIFKYIEKLETNYIKALKIADNKNNIEWLEVRKESKENNKSFREVLKELESYTIAQGGSKANLIYSNYTRLVNKLTGTDDTRDSLTPYKLHLIRQIEDILKKTISIGMLELKEHKEIYRSCKNKANEFIKYLQ